MAASKSHTGPTIAKVSHLSSDTDTVLSHYSGYYGKESDDKRTKEREENATNLVQSFYELVTDFYEYGYGECFHFCPVYDHKSMPDAIIEYENGIGKTLLAKKGSKLLDLGCGVGGPARNIARSTGAHVTGLNISDYQIRRARTLTENVGLQKQCTFDKGDFCKMDQYEDNSFDGAFAIESICHSQDPLLVYKEIYRVLKPGALFIQSAWVMTERYQPGDPTHEKIKHQVLVGNGLPDLRSEKALLDKLREAGMEVVESVDYRLQGDLPWYTFLVGKGCFSMQSFRVSWLGRTCTHYALSVLELAHIVPNGTTRVHSVLQTAAEGLVAAGKVDIFTPMLRIVARKPMTE